MTWVRGLIVSGHPLPSLVITAIIATLAGAAGAGPTRLLLFVPAALAAQLSIGWSNDYLDVPRDAVTGRTDKPIVSGRVGRRAVATAAIVALAVSIAFCFLIGPITGVINLVMVLAGWAYNAGLKSTLASGLLYVVHFGLIPAFAASAVPGGGTAAAWMSAAAALLGLGGHFANVLPDLAGDRASGVGGLPQRVAASPGGPMAVRLIALALLLGATGLVTLASGLARTAGPGLVAAGLAAGAGLGALGALGRGRVPFYAAMGIAGLDTILLLVAA
jgi:4-hydroxybenzoate polyprenyltransferase